MAGFSLGRGPDRAGGFRLGCGLLPSSALARRREYFLHHPDFHSGGHFHPDDHPHRLAHPNDDPDTDGYRHSTDSHEHTLEHFHRHSHFLRHRHSHHDHHGDPHPQLPPPGRFQGDGRIGQREPDLLHPGRKRALARRLLVRHQRCGRHYHPLRRGNGGPHGHRTKRDLQPHRNQRVRPTIFYLHQPERDIERGGFLL